MRAQISGRDDEVAANPAVLVELAQHLLASGPGGLACRTLAARLAIEDSPLVS
jgi:hypothetical protein